MTSIPEVLYVLEKIKERKKKLKLLIPMEDLEWSAQQQIYNALKHDFLMKLAVMPDCHTGYSLPIGGVALLDGVISPPYVGYDKGCGMCFIVTNILAKDFFRTEKRKIKMFEKIQKYIPMSVGVSRTKGLDYNKFKSASGDRSLNKKVASRLHIQLGTLGSGNHFIEIGVNRDGFITITIHSGSRNPGYTTAGYYMKLAKRVDKDLPKGFLHLNGEYGQQYLQDLNFFLDYALENRKRMMEEILSFFVSDPGEKKKLMSQMINENHNHAVVYGNTVLHRKGATPAEKGQIGIIPGSMKTGVYVTEGLGNDEYLNSSSHGAGRKMSRTIAKEKIKLEVFEKQMKGIVAKVGKSTIDEAPDAYKDLHKVIKAQEGIVIKTIDYSSVLVNVKG